jgi:hypothetical protein
MIDELRDLTSHLIDAFCLVCFTTAFSRSLCYTGTVRQLAFYSFKTRYRNQNKGVGQRPLYPRAQSRLRKISQEMGMRKAHGDVHHPQTKEGHSQRDERIQRTSVTGALRELTLVQPALLSASG